MKVFQTSDVHLEFYNSSQQEEIINNWPKADTIIIAGDINNKGTDLSALRTNLHQISQLYDNVIFIVGNHEYWNRDHNTIYYGLLPGLPDNVHWLHRTLVTIDGITFAGCLNWPRLRLSHFWEMDLPRMKNKDRWLLEEIDLDREFLDDIIFNDKADIIITHFFPSRGSIAERWLQDGGNWYFCCYQDPLLEQVKRDIVWFAGHTHDPSDVQSGKVRCVNNPRGYPHERLEYPDRYKDKVYTIEKINGELKINEK